MKSLYWNNSLEIESAYIIRVKGNKNSESHADTCIRSCDAAGMKYKIWDAYDGTGGEIITPPALKDNWFMNSLKITDHYLTRGEVACALSHISLWLHCTNIDRPIVILEHDAVMVKKIEMLNSYNSITYLGGNEWAEQGWKIHPVPPHASEGPNYHFICRAHAYAIDPIVAKNMLAHVLKMGIIGPLDIMLRADLFNITHQGLFAYDKNYDKIKDTTIKARPVHGRSTTRNDNLQN